MIPWRSSKLRDEFPESIEEGLRFVRMEVCVATATAMNNLKAIARCQLCGQMRQTARVKFERNIGMLVLRQTRRLEANLCKTCVGSQFWSFQAKNLLLGPWGVISLLLTPIYLVANTVSYASARRELSDAVE